jgi:hypothetical protein
MCVIKETHLISSIYQMWVLFSLFSCSPISADKIHTTKPMLHLHIFNERFEKTRLESRTSLDVDMIIGTRMFVDFLIGYLGPPNYVKYCNKFPINRAILMVYFS